MNKPYTVPEIEKMLSEITKGEWNNRQVITKEAVESDCGLSITPIAESVRPKDAQFISASPRIVRELLGRVTELESALKGMMDSHYCGGAVGKCDDCDAAFIASEMP